MTRSEKIGLQQSIGQRICIARDVAGLTQTEVARRVGLSRTQITNIEAGRSDVPVTTLQVREQVGCTTEGKTAHHQNAETK